MKLYYLTRTEIPSNAAQARQIISMCRAFHRRMRQGFTLVCAVGNHLDEDFRYRKTLFNPVARLRYIGICIEALLIALKDREAVFYTRDVAVAAIIALVGRKVLYEAHKQPMNKTSDWLVRILAGKKNFKLVAISRALADFYSSTYSVTEENIAVAHDGVFPEEYAAIEENRRQEIRRDLGIPDESLFVLHTGSLYKGGAELFEFVLCGGHPEVAFVHIGGAAGECDYWARYYRDRGYSNIRFLTHQDVEYVRQCQLSADLLFYVTTRESPIYWCTSPLKIFEYMAAGVPILAARIGSVAEIISDSNAFCFDPDAPKSIQDALIAFRNAGEEADARAGRAREMAEREYSWHVRVSRLIDFISK